MGGDLLEKGVTGSGEQDGGMVMAGWTRGLKMRPEKWNGWAKHGEEWQPSSVKGVVGDHSSWHHDCPALYWRLVRGTVMQPFHTSSVQWALPGVFRQMQVLGTENKRQTLYLLQDPPEILLSYTDSCSRLLYLCLSFPHKSKVQKKKTVENLDFSVPMLGQ